MQVFELSKMIDWCLTQISALSWYELAKKQYKEI